MNKRAFTRFELAEWATIRYNNQSYGGMAKNISLRGIYIQTNQRIPLNTPVDISVHHTIDSSLDFTATVIRHDSNGLGIQINRMDIHSLVHLKEMLAHQCGCQEQAMQETRKMVGHMIA